MVCICDASLCYLKDMYIAGTLNTDAAAATAYEMMMMMIQDEAYVVYIFCCSHWPCCTMV